MASKGAVITTKCKKKMFAYFTWQGNVSSEFDSNHNHSEDLWPLYLYITTWGSQVF